MKKLINRPDHVVSEMIDGLLAANPALARLSHHNVLLRSDIDTVRNGQVALISGGGSGHEPAHAGYIGSGMLSAAVAGEVFSSPSSDSVYAAIQAVTGPPGVLLIIKNYTGDRLNFGLAAEMARAEGIRVASVLVADDIALADKESPARRRGIAGTVLVHKIAGAAAAEGKPLEEVARIASEAAASIASMGISLSAGTVPAVGKPSFTLADTEAELGLGIHGEPGIRRIALDSADAITEQLLESILAAQQLTAGEKIALLVNNLGSTTPMELAIVVRRALSLLRDRGIQVKRVLSGTFMSSLEMAGVSLSSLRLDNERLRFLDAPTDAIAWPRLSSLPLSSPQARTVDSPALQATPHSVPGARETVLERAIRAACDALLQAQEGLTEMDRLVGDGDLGITLARGASALLKELPVFPFADPATTLVAIAHLLRRELGGSSGPLYGVLFLRAGHVLQHTTAGDPASWADASQQACQAVSELGGAGPGDRTMLDALLPFSAIFRQRLTENVDWKQALDLAVSEAEAGAQATAHMKPRRGRAAYLGDRALGHPDPGAIAVSIWLRAVASVL